MLGAELFCNIFHPKLLSLPVILILLISFMKYFIVIFLIVIFEFQHSYWATDSFINSTVVFNRE